MRFQVQISLVVAVCVAALFQGACSASSTSDALLEPTSVIDSERSVDDNGKNDENSILIGLAKLFIKQFGCTVAKAKAASCGFRELSEIPLILLAPLDRSPGGGYGGGYGDVDQASFSCNLAKFIRQLC